ncbi:hypothetical protein BC628DRAFT_1418476 [Trametes gibbosa]|nr:hypothetical protein BC628DRAFT_1423789 [Trametes gibbosa]KAI0827363.1 hypothetical protein BC628DRAFT_1418476 [Trametes gibbosa]
MSEASSDDDKDVPVAKRPAPPLANRTHFAAPSENIADHPPSSSPLPGSSPPAISGFATHVALEAPVVEEDIPSPSDNAATETASSGAGSASLHSTTMVIASNRATGSGDIVRRGAADGEAGLTLPGWVTERVRSRLVDMMAFTDSASSRFAIAQVPEGHWGRMVKGIDNSRVFCIHDDPLTVWLVGAVHSLWFQDNRGVLQERASIGLDLFRSEDVKAAVKLLALSEPVKAPRQDVIYVGRFMSERVKGKSAPNIKLFEEIYDATRPGMRRADLPRKMHYDLGVGDVVLVEAGLIRYKTGDTRLDWNTCKWNTSFELKSISIIAEAPIAPATSTTSIHDDERIL